MKWIEHFLCLSLLCVGPVFCELFTAGAFIAGMSVLGYKYGDKVKLNTYCKKYECCHEELIPHDLLSLQNKLESKVFGQHIIQEKLFKAIASHYENIENSRKPLVMTFHGTQGTGKNYVSNMIAEAVFERGTESSFFHLFHGSQYDNRDRTYEHKEEIKNEIFKAIDACAYSIFVFDEIDKMPPGIFDSITSMLDHHTLVKRRDFKKAVFIFLTNSGGEEMTVVLHKLINIEGLYRHETKLNHFEEIMKLGVFNKDGGLKDSHLIKQAVIDFYFPFLPLEAQHISQCIVEEYRLCNMNEVSQSMIDEILKNIGFNSITHYAHTGCKTIYAKVQTECYSQNSRR